MQALKPALQYSQGRSSTWGGAKLVNCFAEKADGDKRQDFAVLPTPGLTEWSEIGSGPIRGGIELNGVLHVVSGNELYRVQSDGTGVLVGTIVGTGPTRMAVNRTELAIVGGTIGYVYGSGTLNQPLDYDVTDVLFVDGYILWVVDGSDQFFISALDDAMTYAAADLGTAEGLPDNIVGAVNNHRDIVFLGQDSTEVFYNSGNPDFPFARQGSVFIEYGCFDRDSIVKLDGGIFFVGRDKSVYLMTGYQVQRISTHAIEYEIRNTAYARGFFYRQEGHKFYCLEAGAGTWVFDLTTGAWHRRQSYGMDHWRCGSAFTAFGGILLGDRETGKLYRPDPDAFTEDGNPILMDFYLPTIEAGRERVTMHSFEVLCEAGVGNGSVTDPQAMLRYSDDGGHLWSNEMWRSLGTVGNYRTRAVWRKLGQFRQRQMHLRIADSVKRLVISWSADIG